MRQEAGYCNNNILWCIIYQYPGDSSEFDRAFKQRDSGSRACNVSLGQMHEIGEYRGYNIS